MKVFRSAAGLLACLLAAACSTDVVEQAGGAAGSSPVGGGGPPTTATAACPAQPVPRTPLRRLTRFEYGNAARDLLGVDTSGVETLPPDEVTNSFDNNAAVLTVSALHAEKYILLSEALAKAAVSDVTKLTGCSAQEAGDAACASAFAKRLARRAFRRASTAADEQALMTAYAAGHDGGTHAEGIEVMLRAALQSPHFLYRLELSSAADTRAQVPLNAFEIATRLSFLLWGSGPDDALLDAAERGELGDKPQVAARARTMLSDPRARGAVVHFFQQWSGLERLPLASKSADFPQFSAEAKLAMEAELPAFIERVLWSGDRSLRTLLTEPVAYVDAALAPIYGVAAPASPGFVALPAEQGRAGLLTQAGFLSVQGHPDQTSAVLRGKFVRAMLLCQPPAPPPDDVDISPPDSSEGATARERLASHLAAGASCSGCHSLMDPIGLAFESFDAVGRFRDREGTAVIDTSGEITGTSDPALAGAFANVRGMAEKLGESQQVRDCLATQYFRFGSGRLEAEADTCSLSGMREAFVKGDVLELLVASTQTDAFWFRSPITP